MWVKRSKLVKLGHMRVLGSRVRKELRIVCPGNLGILAVTRVMPLKADVNFQFSYLQLNDLDDRG
jgi:hypothetical protein